MPKDFTVNKEKTPGEPLHWNHVTMEKGGLTTRNG